MIKKMTLLMSVILPVMLLAELFGGVFSPSVWYKADADYSDAATNVAANQNECSVNAGGNATICGTSYTLQGSSSGSTSGNPTWSLVSKPSGATDPVISNPNILTPNVTGINSPGNYVFQVSQPCDTGTVTNQVTITAPGDVSAFTAGPDITGIPATTGVANLNATIPAGYTASWTYFNIYNFETNGTIATTNATMSNTTTATPTLTLTNKANHTIDPAYRAVLRITSNINPSCWYEDYAIVRFIPNPNMLWNATASACVAPGTTGDGFYYDPTGASPRLATTTANSSGNPAFGTTVSMAVVSQPPGGNMQYSRMSNGRLHFSGITATGPYVFDLTISNSTGSSTTRLTYNFNGYQPSALTFIDPAYPNQMELFSFGNTGGALYCNMVGSTAPITFYYKINAADPPTIADDISIGTVVPAGGPPTYVQSGAGTANRSVTLTPPSGGWRAGTYKIAVTLTAAGNCKRQHTFYAHISDNVRPAVNVDNITVCYPGSGVVTATVPLPAIYKTTAANPSYFQDFPGRYDFTLVSSPAGAAIPTYEVAANRSFTSTSTIISNLDKPGEYVFRIKSAASSGSQHFIDAEYACSGTSSEDTFSIFISAQVGANAGSDQSVVGATQTTLNGNNPGVATGAWTLVTKPAGASDPVIVSPSLYNSNVTGLSSGSYTFRWTVTTGTCVSTSDVNINVTINNCVTGCNPNTFVNSFDPNTIEYDNVVSGVTTIAKTNNGVFTIWGQAATPTGGSYLAPTAITTANGFSYTGTPLKATAGSFVDYATPGFVYYHAQNALLTTDGLYVWGSPNRLVSSSIKSGAVFGKITVNGKTDGLPAGVTPLNVKMMFGSHQTLAIVTCSGEAWVLSMTGNKNGDGTAQNATNNVIWHRVKTSAANNLNNVVAVRGNALALFALTSDGKLYTWGTGTYLGNGSAVQNRTYATEVTVPNGVTPKMIGMTMGTATSQPYYMLATDGRLFAMGENAKRQLGDGTIVNKTTWVQTQKMTDQNGQGTGPLVNIAWISPNEHTADNNTNPRAGINVLTNNKKLWGWGIGRLIGGPSFSTYYDPIYMPGISTNTNGMKLTDEIIMVETGGDYALNYKKGSDKFGFVGYSVYNKGDGSNTIQTVPVYAYDTAVLMTCGADTSSFCYKPGATGTALTSSVGILTKGEPSVTGWPEVVPNGYLVLDGAFKGMVITHMTTAQINALTPVEGMLVFDTNESCVKLYRGTTPSIDGSGAGWVCIQRGCNE